MDPDDLVLINNAAETLHDHFCWACLRKDAHRAELAQRIGALVVMEFGEPEDE